MSGIFSYLIFFLVLASIYGITSMGLNLQWGYTGLFNIGVAGFFAIGAYAYAILASAPSFGHFGGFSIPIVISILLAMLVTGLAALIIGFPTLRLRDDYLAIATIGIAISIKLVAMNMQWLTGGTQGFYDIPQPLADIFKSNVEYNIFFLGVVLVILLLLYIALELMLRSPWGRVLMAIREDEIAAGSLGKAAFSYRLQSFVIGSMIMGLGGALYACFFKYISPQDFQSVLTFQIWAMLIIGGSGNNRGAMLGALLVWMLWSGSGTVVQWILPSSMQAKVGAFQIILIGLVLMMTLIFKPKGILGKRQAIVPTGR